MGKRHHSSKKTRHRISDKLKVSSRTRLIYQTAVGVQNKSGCNSNMDTVTNKRDVTPRSEDENMFDLTQKPESPLPYEPNNKVMQELLELKGILSDSDEDIFDYPPRPRRSTEPTRNDSNAYVNETDNGRSTLQPMDAIVDSRNEYTLTQTELFNIDNSDEISLETGPHSHISPNNQQDNAVFGDTQRRFMDRIGSYIPRLISHQPNNANVNKSHTLVQNESLNLINTGDETILETRPHSHASPGYQEIQDKVNFDDPQCISTDRVDNCTPHPSPNHSNPSRDACTSHFCPCLEQQPCPSPCISPDRTDSVLSTPQANSPFISSTNPSTPASGHSRRSTIRKDKGKIRGRHFEDWIDNKRKKLRNSGKEYKTRKGKITPAKNMGAKCPTTCRMKCFSKISEQQRKLIFESFWELGDRPKQWGYIAQLAIRQIKRRIFSNTQSRRKYTIQYKLPASTNDTSEVLQYVNVCKKMFLGTFSVSEQFVKVALDKLDQTTGIQEGDHRGKHGNHRKVITDEIKDSVCAHIRSLKPVEAHYTRKESSKLYLDGDLTYRRLYELYVEWAETNSYISRALTERQYHDIVNENFNIAFHVPKKDQCDQCHTFNNLNTPSVLDINKHDAHISNKTITRQLKSQDKQEAKASDGKIIAASFDFQKILNAPHGEISVLYYKRKLSVFNFTVFSLGEKEGTCFMWHEGQGKRGANEVSSCLLDYMANKTQKGALEFRFWSDNCVGQNRNRIVYILYVYAALRYNVKISHSFLEKGHTQAESDSVHALIEREAKNKLIYTPFEWYSLVRWAKKDGKPYDVREMEHTDFFDFKSLLQGRNWAKNLRGEKVEWNKIKKIEICPDDPYKINYKYNINDQFSTVSISSNNTRAKKKAAPLSPSLLYPGPLPIAKAKMDDLMSLCSSGIIPKSYGGFFSSLQVTDTETVMSGDESD